VKVKCGHPIRAILPPNTRPLPRTSVDVLICCSGSDLQDAVVYHACYVSAAAAGVEGAGAWQWCMVVLPAASITWSQPPAEFQLPRPRQPAACCPVVVAAIFYCYYCDRKLVSRTANDHLSWIVYRSSCVRWNHRCWLAHPNCSIIIIIGYQW